ncbi:MAG: hypothetical protein NZ519_01295 [Bacteroidia bacterium]|nr:hypothetical protein [Bacteroidia bacterium]MDW8301349.1 hypothetical protein [Bacteroidia bacterium]
MILCIVFFLSCNKKIDNPGLVSTYVYYPISENKTYKYYVVDSITEGFAPAVLTVFRYYLIETFREIQKDAKNRPIRRFENEYVFIDSPTGHTAKDFYSIFDSIRVGYDYQDKNVVERTLENIRYIILKTPFVSGASWDGNAYNILGKKMYRITTLDTLVNTPAGIYSGMRVLESNKDNIAGLDYSQAIYVKHIGKIAKEIKLVEYNNDQVPKPVYIRHTVQLLQELP